MSSNKLQLHIRAHGGTLVDSPFLSITQLVGGPPAPWLLQGVRDGVLAAQLGAVDSRLSPLTSLGCFPSGRDLRPHPRCCALRMCSSTQSATTTSSSGCRLQSDCGLSSASRSARASSRRSSARGRNRFQLLSDCATSASLDLSVPREAWADG
jgi:hypothetical protein